MNEEGWIALFNGEDLTGWTPEPAEAWTVTSGTLTQGSTAVGNLTSIGTFSDFDLQMEFRLSEGGKASLLYRAGAIGAGTAASGYDLRLQTQGEGLPGTLWSRLGSPAPTIPATQWNRLEIHACGAIHEIRLNDQSIASGTETAFRAGQLRILVPEPGTQLEIKKLWIRPLGFTSLFNGTDFTGWRIRKQVEADRPAPDIRIEEGAIRLQGGPGYVETVEEFSDFHLRLKIKSAPREDSSSNSGVFIRGPIVPGDNFTIWPEGLEAQVFNEPKDFTTGGWYHHVKARAVYADNNEWFWMDLNAVGNRYESWINGMPAAVWIDPENRFLKGILALQAHDPKSITHYQRIEISPIPPHTQ
jgi:hypothetical protein